MSLHLTIVTTVMPVAGRATAEHLVRGRDAALLSWRAAPTPDLLLRVVRRGVLILHQELLRLEQSCGSCTVADDLPHALGDLLARPWCRDAVVELPTGLDAEVVLRTLDLMDLPVQVDSVVTAVDPGALEVLLWDGSRLRERGVAVPGHDERSCGEFGVDELVRADTYAMVAVTGPFEQVADGRRLLQHLAPQARATEVPGAGSSVGLPAPSLRTGTWDPVESWSRSKPGAVVTPGYPGGDGLCTVVCRMARPLHPQRLHERMPDLAAGSVWSRGHVWIASVPRCRVVWWGVGPEAGLEDGGRWVADTARTAAEVLGSDADVILGWHPDYGDRGTVLALTGHDLDGHDLQVMLDECALTDDEMEAGPTAWPGLFPDPLALHATFTEHARSSETIEHHEKES